MFDAGFAGVGEEIFPADGALADVRHAAAIFDGLTRRSLVSARRRGVLHPVFYVNQRETAGMLFEIRQRILAGDADPAEIHFHGDESGIRFGEEEIVRKFSAERLGGLEFERVIVIAELDAHLFAGFTGAIEELRGALPSAGLRTLYFADPGANDVVLPDGVRGLQS